VTSDVLQKQIPSLNSGQQAILLSIGNSVPKYLRSFKECKLTDLLGGNDIQLVDVLNQCIYQWAVLNQEQVIVAKLAALDKKYEWAADYDWDKLGLGCAGQLDQTQSLIASNSFSNNLDAVLNATKAKLAPG
jgi:hypothetical protein